MFNLLTHFGKYSSQTSTLSISIPVQKQTNQSTNDKKTGKNQQHVDYVFSIASPEKKTLYQQTLHSSWGVESASYKFQTGGLFTPKVTIDAILFQPVEPVEDDFKIPVKA